MNDRYVTVEQYQFLPEAQAVQMHLQSEGIPVQLADAETVSTDWALGNAVGYIKLQVPQSHAEEAATILDKLRTRRLEREKSPDSDDAGRCLSCGHALQPDEVKCPVCGWSFADGEDSPDALDRETLTARPIAESNESTLDELRSLKKPLVGLMLGPALLGIVIVALSLLLTIVTFIMGD